MQISKSADSVDLREVIVFIIKKPEGFFSSTLNFEKINKYILHRIVFAYLFTICLFVYYLLGHSRKDCNTGPTRGESGASPGHLACVQKSV